MLKRVKYVAASTPDEAWLRFRAKLTAASVEEALETAELLAMRDTCDEHCQYDVYEVRVEIENVADGYPQT